MPRTKGSKNKPKTVIADFATQIAEKQSAKEELTAEIASLTVIRQIKNVFDSHFILGHLKDVFCRQSVCFMPLGQIIYW